MRSSPLRPAAMSSAYVDIYVYMFKCLKESRYQDQYGGYIICYTSDGIEYDSGIIKLSNATLHMR